MKKEIIPALRFQALTRFYDPVVRLTTRERTVKRALIEQARVPDNATVIDIGCGTGTLTIGIKKKYPSARVIGLDADPQILSYAESKAEKACVDVDFHRGSAMEMPFEAASADRVVSSLFFHHLQPADKKRTFAEIQRVFVDGGELHISDWGAPSNLIMRALFVPVQILDGFSNTQENHQGRLPALVAESGLRNVTEQGSYNTVFGTLRLLSAKK